MSSAVHEFALDQETAGAQRGEGRGLFNAARLVPTFSLPRLDDGRTVPDAPPFSVPLAGRPERGRENTSTAFGAALDIERPKLPGGRPGWSGAREPVRMVRRFLDVPVADPMIGRPIPSGGIVDFGPIPGEEPLHAPVTRESRLAAASRRVHTARETAVQWGGFAPTD